MNADESISIPIPLTIGGGEQQVFVRRADGIESNRVNLGIKPQLDLLTDPLVQGGSVTLRTRLGWCDSVTRRRDHSNSFARNSIPFSVPGTGGSGSTGGTVTVQVRNPDGRVSNSRTGTQPRILEVPFGYGQHNLSFNNFDDGIPIFPLSRTLLERLRCGTSCLIQYLGTRFLPPLTSRSTNTSERRKVSLATGFYFFGEFSG